MKRPMELKIIVTAGVNMTKMHWEATDNINGLELLALFLLAKRDCDIEIEKLIASYGTDQISPQ